MKILTINAGSSSLKYQLMSLEEKKVIAKGICERIGLPGSALIYKPTGRDAYEFKKNMKDHTDAMKMVLGALIDLTIGVIASMEEISAVGHRVAHGGDKFTSSALITDEMLATMEELTELAPLHNPANLMGVRACREIMGDIPMVGVFDTAFHQTMPKKAYLYAIPYEAYTQKRIRRYGFHGTSHLYVSERAVDLLGKPLEDTKIITCHLGNGSSITAINGGKSVDTTMGFTPLEGLPMGSRCGDIDPAIVTYLMDNNNWGTAEVNDYLNKQSGMCGLSGVSPDFRDLWVAHENGNERATIALEVFCYKVKRYIGSYAAVMNGVDAIVFTAGIGENDSGVREWVMKDMDYLGVDFNLELNRNCPRGKEFELTYPNSRTKVFVIPTDEEMIIARDTARIAKL